MKDQVIITARIILCKQLREIAEANNITQDDVALATGMHRATINRMFNGRFSPTLDTYLKVCRAVKANVFIEDKNGNSDMAKVMRDVSGCDF